MSLDLWANEQRLNRGGAAVGDLHPARFGAWEAIVLRERKKKEGKSIGGPITA